MENQKSAREEILRKLKAAEKKAAPPRPDIPALNELSLNGDELVAKFIKEITAQTGVVHRVEDKHGARSRLTSIVQAEGISTVMVSNDDVVTALDLAAWGAKNSVKVLNSQDFNDRKRFTSAVFEEAQVGITGADFAVAESGTIGLIHNQDQPRLISLAPIHHIAIVPLDRLVPVYENVTEILFDQRETTPNHFTFITGPSMTADIQATPFKGMHGPRKLEIILIGSLQQKGMDSV
jgi:L-lactate dehydrogenase complex protein LldG